MNSGTLFSIDVDAHLQKAASHTFGSPSHFPVELVRAALKRGADVVSVEIGRNRIRVVDNGNGFGEADIETLNCILDPARSTAHKEAAIEALQNRSNYGLLAIFAPSPLRIHIENALLGSSGTTIVTHGGHLEVLPHSSHGPGTSITLTTGGGR
ncbi:MAG: hypothetical protein GY765_29520, partial [bacterium]|nr:hypothetical protein [bacterium]